MNKLNTIALTKIKKGMDKYGIKGLCEKLDISRVTLHNMTTGASTPENMKLSTARIFKKVLNISYDDWFDLID